MKNKSKLWKPVVIVVVIAIIGGGCGTSQSNGSGTVSGSPSIAAGNENGYILKYEWPEKPKVGKYTLKVNLMDKTGNPVKDTEVVVSYDMPSMRGHHAATEIMKQNAKGDYLLPIHFAMQGDWEIIISAHKDGREIATELILLDI